MVEVKFDIGDRVSFKYANIDRIGKIIGKTKTRKPMFLVEFEYRPKQTKSIWLHRNVLKFDINGEM